MTIKTWQERLVDAGHAASTEGMRINTHAQAEIDELRARLDAWEQQEPYGFVDARHDLNNFDGTIYKRGGFDIMIERISMLTQAVDHLSRLVGARLTRAEVCARLRVHRNTLQTYIAERNFPTPGRDGKWLLSEVIEWESGK